MILRDYQQNDFLSVSYSDDAPWPGLADGDGYSLVPTETNPTGNPNNSAYWMLSYDDDCGSPGTDDSASTLSVSDNSEISKLFHVYPNPANDFVNIAGDLQSVNSIEIHDTAGKLVYHSSNPQSKRISITGLSEGLYFVSFSTDEGLGVKKLMVNK